VDKFFARLGPDKLDRIVEKYQSRHKFLQFVVHTFDTPCLELQLFRGMEEFSRLDWLVVESKGPFPFKSTQLNVKGECRPAGCEITLLQRIDQVPGVLYRGIPELLLSGCASVFRTHSSRLITW